MITIVFGKPAAERRLFLAAGAVTYLNRSKGGISFYLDCPPEIERLNADGFRKRFTLPCIPAVINLWALDK